MNIDSFFSFEDETPGEPEIWQMLLEEARALAEEALLDSEKVDEIEAKYLQCISCMRPWDNCTQLEWTRVVAEIIALLCKPVSDEGSRAGAIRLDLDLRTIDVGFRKLRKLGSSY